MATADGLTDLDNAKQVSDRHALRTNGIGVVTLAATLALTSKYANVLKLDPGGGARDVTLPAESTSKGMWFEIINAADAAEALTVKNDTPATVVTISQNEKATVICDGTTWHHTGIITIALS